MNNSERVFDAQEVSLLIKSLLSEKERYKQDKLAQKIGNMKDERTAEFVAELFYSDDTYIRNIVIEIFATLGEKALPVLKEKLVDSDRNIRKFVLEALKDIKCKSSCEVALVALDDQDENVVEAALEVIAKQSYKEAEDKLIEMLKNTSSVWSINALIRTFEKLGIKNISGVIEEKISSMDINTIEESILVNTFVRALGSIGSYDDIEVIINKYSKDFAIDNSNLIFGLSNLINKNETSGLSEGNLRELKKVLKEQWDYQDSGQVLNSIAAFVKLQFDFFLNDIKEILNFYKTDEFFKESLYENIQGLKEIPSGFVEELLTSDEPELAMIGLKLIHAKQIPGYNMIVEEMCEVGDRDLSELAICIISEVSEYKNTQLLERLTNFSEKAQIAAIERKDSTELNNIEFFIFELENKNQKVRKAAAQKLASISEKINIEQLEKIVRRNPGEEGIEALELLFRFNADVGLIHIASRTDSMNDNVRAGLIEIMERSSENVFYSFMNTMINDPSHLVRRKAIKALQKRIDDRSLQLLKKLYTDESDTINRMEIVLDLHKFNNDIAFNIITDATMSSDTLTRIASVRSMSLFKSSRANIVLKTMLNDQLEEVREAAKQALHNSEVLI